MVFGIELGDLGLSGVNMPNFASIGSSILWAVFVCVILGGIGVGVWYYLDLKKYKYKIELYENLGGTRYIKTGVDTAKSVRLGVGGEELLWCKKGKCYRSAYGKKMAKNTFWFARGQDGYWYNFILGELDTETGTLDIEPVDRDMRMMHSAIERTARTSYKDKDKWTKYAPWIICGVFMIIMMFGIWFLISKMGDTASANANAAIASQKTMELAKEVLGAVSNIKHGSGIIPA